MVTRAKVLRGTWGRSRSCSTALAILLSLAATGCGGSGSNDTSTPATSGGSGGGSGGGAPSPTPSPAPGPQQNFCTGLGTPAADSSSATLAFAGYLGGGASDALNVVQVAGDCAVYAGGQLSGPVAGAPRLIGSTPETGTGVLVRTNPGTGAVLSAVRFGTVINDAHVRRSNGDIAIASDQGLALLSSNLAQTKWVKSGQFTRVSIAADGTVAALEGAAGKRLMVFAADGALLFERSFGDSQVNDVAVRSGSAPAELRVMVTGMAQRDGGGCKELQVAWIRTFGADSQLAWRAYDWSHAQAFGRNSSCADSRGLRIDVGQDGNLYFAGESAGGNSIFRYDSRDLAAAAPNVGSDAYNQAYNTAANHITYFARLDPSNGALKAGSFLLSRLSSSRGNTIRPRAITADAAGNTYVGGITFASIQNRQSIRLNGQQLADYAGGEPWLLVVGPDLRQRKLWITFANGGQGETLGIDVANGVVAVAAQSDGKSAATGKAMFTTSASATYAGAKAGYLAVLPTP